jgi:hypothetical protein
MFQEMRDTGPASRVFPPACGIESILCHDWRAAEGDEGHIKPIGKPPLLGAEKRALWPRRRGGLG